jgi:hypothetical protein
MEEKMRISFLVGLVFLCYSTLYSGTRVSNGSEGAYFSSEGKKFIEFSSPIILREVVCDFNSDRSRSFYLVRSSLKTNVFNLYYVDTGSSSVHGDQFNYGTGGRNRTINDQNKSFNDFSQAVDFLVRNLDITIECSEKKEVITDPAFYKTFYKSSDSQRVRINNKDKLMLFFVEIDNKIIVRDNEGKANLYSLLKELAGKDDLTFKENFKTGGFFKKTDQNKIDLLSKLMQKDFDPYTELSLLKSSVPYIDIDFDSDDFFIKSDLLVRIGKYPPTKTKINVIYTKYGEETISELNVLAKVCDVKNKYLNIIKKTSSLNYLYDMNYDIETLKDIKGCFLDEIKSARETNAIVDVAYNLVHMLIAYHLNAIYEIVYPDILGRSNVYYGPWKWFKMQDYTWPHIGSYWSGLKSYDTYNKISNWESFTKDSEIKRITASYDVLQKQISAIGYKIWDLQAPNEIMCEGVKNVISNIKTMHNNYFIYFIHLVFTNPEFLKHPVINATQEVMDDLVRYKDILHYSAQDPSGFVKKIKQRYPDWDSICPNQANDIATNIAELILHLN